MEFCNILDSNRFKVLDMRRIITIIILLIGASPSCLFAQGKRPDQFLVLSYRNLEVKELNLQITTAEKKKEEWAFSPLFISMRFHKPSAVRFVSINQKNDRAKCPLTSIVTIVEEGFLDDQMRGRWTEFHLVIRKDCIKVWKVKELRQAYLCGMEGSKEVFLKDLCPETKSGKVTDLWVEMRPANAEVPCDCFPYTFVVKFRITVDGPVAVTFQRMRSDGAVAPQENIVFSEAGTKEFYDYYRVGKPGNYWFRVNVISPNPVMGESSSKLECHEGR
ncbi:MAG: hypothetical protein ACUVUQ_00625 [Thermodesulfovibrionales bacterium]